MTDVKRERVIAEWDGYGWLVMWPDGTVGSYTKQEQVLAAAKKRLGKADVLVTELEWRGYADGPVDIVPTIGPWPTSAKGVTA